MNAVYAPINVNLRGGGGGGKGWGFELEAFFWSNALAMPGTSYLVKTLLQLREEVRHVSLKVTTLSLKCCWYYKQAHQFCQKSNRMQSF